MKKDLSLFLDLWRFAAAMVVFLAHVSSQKLSGGIFWQLKAYDQTAVMVFFVMSGFVIAYVSKTKETNLASYTTARVSRLYSVVIPALVLTYVLDSIGLSINPSFYVDGPWPYSTDTTLKDYALSFLLIHNIWDWWVTPGINGPFWSLTYEVIYYGIFAACFYLRGWRRLVSASIVAVFGGPTILFYFPIWLMGYYLFEKMLVGNGPKESILNGSLSILALLLLIFIGPIIREIEVAIPYISRKEVLADYFDAICFSLHIYFSSILLSKSRELLFKFEKPIRWFASLTFALYLFHRPIIQLIGAVNFDNVESLYNRVLMILGTFIIVAIIGRWSEKQKFTIKLFIEKNIRNKHE